MKFFKKSLGMLAVGFLCLSISFSSCDDGFDELNVDPGVSPSLESRFILAGAINRAASSRFEAWRGNLIYCSQWGQQLSGTWPPDQYVTTNEGWLSAYWIVVYGDNMRNLQRVIDQEEGTNLESMAVIMKILLMQRVTDMHGDIPYSEAFQGGNLPQPRYDTQEEVYASFVSELRAAIAQLSPGNGVDAGPSDPFFNGDIEMWRKFGNSLLLRVAMRMSEVDPATAQTVAAEAINSGIISTDEEMAVLTFTGNLTSGLFTNGIGSVFNDFGIGGGGFALSDELVTRLQDANDPRLAIIGKQYNADGTIDESVGPEDYIGKPNGADITSLFDFVQPDHDVMVSYDAPQIFMSLAEAEFNRAEAIQRGWVSGSAQEAYESGVRAAVRQLSRYPRAAEITEAEIDALLTEDEVAWDESRAIELINTQKWIALLFDGFEGYANFRRIGFPELTPGLMVGESGGTIPKRLRYPSDEILTNQANYEEAVSRMSGGDLITNPVWWDVN